MWIKVLPTKLIYIIVLSCITPLFVHAYYMWRRGLFSFNLALDRIITLMIFSVLIITWGYYLGKTIPWQDFNRVLYTGFFLSLIIPAILANELFKSTLPQLVPEQLEELDNVDLMETMVVGYYTTVPKPVWFVHDGKIETRIKGNAFMGTGASLLTTEPENLAGRRAGPQFVGINLPGATMVNNGTVPSMTVDLRNQIRVDKVECLTLDGIKVRVPISSLFRISWNHHEPQYERTWPFSRPGAEMACLADLIDPKDKTPLEEQASYKWDDLPLFYARKALRRAIRYYTLDQLYGPTKSEVEATNGMTTLPAAIKELHDTHDTVSRDLLGSPFDATTAPPLTRQVIGKLVQAYVRNQLAPRHYTILGGGVGNAIVPVNPHVSEQRIEAWKGRMAQRMLDWQGDVYEKRYRQALQVQETALLNYLNTALSSKSVDALSKTDPTALRGLYLLRQLFQVGSRQETDLLLGDEAYPSQSWLDRQPKDEEES